MLYLLLVASLDFAIPSRLMATALSMAHIDRLGGVMDCMRLFLLPASARARVAMLFLSATLIDREAGVTGGLYPRLSACLQQTGMLLLRLAQCPRVALPAPSVEVRRARSSLRAPRPAPIQDYGNLMAVEVAQLLCLLPEFMSFVGTADDAGLADLLQVATQDDGTYIKVLSLVNSAARQQEHLPANDADRVAWDTYRNLTSCLLQRIQKDDFANGGVPALIATTGASGPGNGSRISTTKSGGAGGIYGARSASSHTSRGSGNSGEASIFPGSMAGVSSKVATAASADGPASLSVGDTVMLPSMSIAGPPQHAQVVSLHGPGMAVVQRLRPSTAATASASAQISDVMRSSTRSLGGDGTTVGITADSQGGSSSLHGYENVRLDELVSVGPRTWLFSPASAAASLGGVASISAQISSEGGGFLVASEAFVQQMRLARNARGGAAAVGSMIGRGFSSITTSLTQTSRARPETALRPGTAASLYGGASPRRASTAPTSGSGAFRVESSAHRYASSGSTSTALFDLAAEPAVHSVSDTSMVSDSTKLAAENRPQGSAPNVSQTCEADEHAKEEEEQEEEEHQGTEADAAGAQYAPAPTPTSIFGDGPVAETARRSAGDGSSPGSGQGSNHSSLHTSSKQNSNGNSGAHTDDANAVTQAVGRSTTPLIPLTLELSALSGNVLEPGAGDLSLSSGTTGRNGQRPLQFEIGGIPPRSRSPTKSPTKFLSSRVSPTRRTPSPTMMASMKQHQLKHQHKLNTPNSDSLGAALSSSSSSSRPRTVGDILSSSSSSNNNRLGGGPMSLSSSLPPLLTSGSRQAARTSSSSSSSSSSYHIMATTATNSSIDIIRSRGLISGHGRIGGAPSNSSSRSSTTMPSSRFFAVATPGTGRLAAAAAAACGLDALPTSATTTVIGGTSRRGQGSGLGSRTRASSEGSLRLSGRTLK